MNIIKFNYLLSSYLFPLTEQIFSAVHFGREMSEAAVDSSSQPGVAKDSVTGPDPELESFPVQSDGVDTADNDQGTQEPEGENPVKETSPTPCKEYDSSYGSDIVPIVGQRSVA